MSRDSALDFQVTGRVQGVGFRAFVLSSARQFGLTGWVKNHVDGSVIGHVEGDSGLVIEFLKQLKIGNRYSTVRALDYNPSPVSGDWPQFEIRY